jgi:hypothetical protein
MRRWKDNMMWNLQNVGSRVSDVFNLLPAIMNAVIDSRVL